MQHLGINTYVLAVPRWQLAVMTQQDSSWKCNTKTCNHFKLENNGSHVGGVPEATSNIFEMAVMRKHVISIVVGDNLHFVSFLAVNFGAHFKEGSPADREPSFIANLDSFGGGESMNKFVYWLLLVIYEIEVWVTQFLNTPSGVVIVNPKLADIGHKCKREARSLDHRVCEIPIQHVPQIPQQSDGYNCGIVFWL
jgi:hypothetical protein